MNKLYFFLTLFVFMSAGFFCNAQSVIGLTGGYYKAKLFDKDDTPHYNGEYNSHPSFCLGAFLKPRNHEYLNLGIGISYFKCLLDVNASYGGNGGSQTSIDNHYNLDYLSLSFFPEVSVGKKLTLNISIGPSLGFLLNAHVSGNTDGGSSGNTSYSGNANEDFKKFMLRLFGNIGVEIPVYKQFKIAIDGSGSFSLSTISSDLPSFLGTRDVSLTIGVIYKLNNFTFSLLPKHKEKSEK